MIFTCKLYFLILASTLYVSSSPRARSDRERSNGSCSKEKCSLARTSLKISSDCVRAPFCVRQIMRDLKKVSREKSLLEKASKREVDDSSGIRNEYTKLMEVQGNMETKMAKLSEEKASVEEKYRNLLNEHESLKTSEALLRTTKAGMKVANKMLETKTKELAEKNIELSRKLESIESQKSMIDQMKEEKSSLKIALDDVTDKLKAQIDKNNEIVKSLEMVENQNALNTQNLSVVVKENLEIKSAMEVLKTQKSNLREKVTGYLKTEEELKKVQEELKSKWNTCQNEMTDLRSVNANCKAKIGELNICKTEISKLAKIVEERLTQVKSKNDDIVSFREKNDALEQNLKEAKEELELFNSNLDKKARILKELEVRLNQCEAAQEENREQKGVKECESPCTISKLAGNDLISNSKDNPKIEALQLENDKLLKKLENTEESLKLCEQNEIPVVNKEARDTILQELLS